MMQGHLKLPARGKEPTLAEALAAAARLLEPKNENEHSHLPKLCKPHVADALAHLAHAAERGFRRRAHVDEHEENVHQLCKVVELLAVQQQEALCSKTAMNMKHADTDEVGVQVGDPVGALPSACAATYVRIDGAGKFRDDAPVGLDAPTVTTTPRQTTTMPTTQKHEADQRRDTSARLTSPRTLPRPSSSPELRLRYKQLGEEQRLVEKAKERHEAWERQMQECDTAEKRAALMRLKERANVRRVELQKKIEESHVRALSPKPVIAARPASMPLDSPEAWCAWEKRRRAKLELLREKRDGREMNGATRQLDVKAKITLATRRNVDASWERENNVLARYAMEEVVEQPEASPWLLEDMSSVGPVLEEGFVDDGVVKCLPRLSLSADASTSTRGTTARRRIVLATTTTAY
ncbi:hypothetical protein PPROV_000534800 [Pycnococcus provasolii]|uniref:Uncharacterized protein n=1 Tax=Pycnococcus provasolii TaxID=41880 RepID=A0A830HJ51_9CHLO|nr:hypothetical protein PPROV_000534800 [Pycnococcus provasolii]